MNQFLIEGHWAYILVAMFMAGMTTWYFYLLLKFMIPLWDIEDIETKMEEIEDEQ
jgi:hypothetical protein